MKRLVKQREFLAAALMALLFAFYANASSIYVWSSGEVLTSAQLNANFSHIHNNMVGGHGARLVDADVSATAAISRSKLAAYQSLPVAWAEVAACTSSPCTVSDSYGVSSVTRTSAGLYVVNLSASLGDTAFAVFVTGKDQAGPRYCQGDSTTATTATVTCYSLVPAAADTGFQVVIFDNN